MGKNIGFMLTSVLFCSFLLLNVSGAQENRASPVYEQVMDKLENLTPGETIEVLIGTEKEQYNVGDPFEIRFQTDKDCYMVLMDIASAEENTYGDIIFLLPSSLASENKIEGGRVYSTLYDFGMGITVAPPHGFETINIFCSAKKFDLFETDFDQEPFYVITPDNEERLQALSNQLDRLMRYEWSGNSVKVIIGPRTRAVPKKHGGLKPIGSTGTTGKWFPPVGSTGTTGKK